MANKTTGIRSAVAAAAVVMAVAGCGGSSESAGENSPTSQPTAGEVNTGTEETETTDPSDEAVAGDDGGPDNVPVAAPAEDFAPCDVLTADEVGGIVELALEDGAADEMMGVQMCEFSASEGSAFVSVQWIPREGDPGLEALVEEALTGYESETQPGTVQVAGAVEATSLTGELFARQAAAVYAEVEGGLFEAVVLDGEASQDQMVQLMELTLSKA